MAKNKYGQYFTPEIVADFMVSLADISKHTRILEPSCGEGVFLKTLINQEIKNIIAYEIDTNLSTEYSFVNHESFISAKITEQFDLIIGNPPYIRWKNLEQPLKEELLANQLWNTYFNSLCDYLYIFILKSIELLKENGQLIFICPEYWFNTTHSLSLRNYMVSKGYFETIIHFSETPIFDNVATSAIIFKYIKSSSRQNYIDVSKFYGKQKIKQQDLNDLKNKVSRKEIEYLEVAQFSLNEPWLLCSNETRENLNIFEKKCLKINQIDSLFESYSNNHHTIGEICEIGNGLVSGLDKAFQISQHDLNIHEQQVLLKVVKAKDIQPFYYNNLTTYFYLQNLTSEDELKTTYPHFYEHLQPYKQDLEKRYQYNQVIPYWKWVFPRNFNLFNRPEKRIFVPCKERISHKSYFRFALVESGIYPTQDVTALFKKEHVKESIEYITCFLNHPRVFEWLTIKGILKGNIVEFSEKPLASIPFRAIDWNNPFEVDIHHQITQHCQLLLKTRNNQLIFEINELMEILLK